jgi:hypothetical protein
VPIDLNEEVTLHSGRRITIYALIHDYDLAVRFIKDIAKGSTADHGSTESGYESRRRFARRGKREAEQLLKELGEILVDNGSAPDA